MRYFARIAYNGTNYSGWQRQPREMSVQQQIEESLSLILRTEITITGCGRTDTGVHASDYILHFDYDENFPKGFIRRLNKVLPKDIVFYDIFEVAADAHARFDASSRSYEYHIDFRKNPFHQNTIYFYPYVQKPHFEKMNEAAQLLLQYKEFSPFCKTNSDAKTMKCDIQFSRWEKINDYHWIYHVSANRFLRGMVRLIVGMCLNVGTDKLMLKEVQEALDEQKPLKKSFSVSPEGLFLSQIKYPYL